MRQLWVLLILLTLFGLSNSTMIGLGDCDGEGTVYIADQVGEAGFIFPVVSEVCASSDGFVSATVTIENPFRWLYVGFTIESSGGDIQPDTDSDEIWKKLQVIPPSGIISGSVLQYGITFTEQWQSVEIATNILSGRALIINTLIASVNAVSASGTVPAPTIVEVLASSGEALATLDDLVDTIDCFSDDGVGRIPTISDWYDCILAMYGLLQNELFINLVEHISRQLGLQLRDGALDQILAGADLGFTAADVALVVDNLSAGGTASVSYVLRPDSNVLINPPPGPLLNRPKGIITNNNDIVFNWSPRTGQPIAGFELEISQTRDFSVPYYGITLRNLFAFSVPVEFTSGTTYYWRVRALNQVGESEWSNAEFTISPNPYPCGDLLDAIVTPDTTARVAFGGFSSNVRSEPSTSASRVGQLEPGSEFTITGEPVCSDGFRWWPITGTFGNGWIADGNSDEYWIEPILEMPDPDQFLGIWENVKEFPDNNPIIAFGFYPNQTVVPVVFEGFYSGTYTLLNETQMEMNITLEYGEPYDFTSLVTYSLRDDMLFLDFLAEHDFRRVQSFDSSDFVSCDGLLPSRLLNGFNARVNTAAGITSLDLRAEPSTDATIVDTVTPGSRFFVTDSPVCEDGLTWWNVVISGSEQVGYLTESNAEEYFILPMPNN